MALLTVQNIADTGVVPTYAAAAAQDTFKIDSAQRHFYHVKNGGGSSIDVTINAVKTSINVPGVGTLAIEDIVVAVANGAEKMIGPITEAYATAAGIVTVDHSATSSVTVAAFKLGA